MPTYWLRIVSGNQPVAAPSTERSGSPGCGIGDQDHGDVVGAAGVYGELHHVEGGAERVVLRLGQREPGQVGGLGQVVPQAIRAYEQGAGPGRGVLLHVRLARRVTGQVGCLGTEPAGQHVRVG